MKNQITWRAYTLHVDLETGEQLTPTRVKNENYKKIKTDKHAKTFNKWVRGTHPTDHTHGLIEYTIGYIRNQQQTIW